MVYSLHLLYRFCSECRAKVIRAFAILLGELDFIAEKEYRKQLNFLFFFTFLAENFISEMH